MKIFRAIERMNWQPWTWTLFLHHLALARNMSVCILSRNTLHRRRRRLLLLFARSVKYLSRLEFITWRWWGRVWARCKSRWIVLQIHTYIHTKGMWPHWPIQLCVFFVNRREISRFGDGEQWGRRAMYHLAINRKWFRHHSTVRIIQWVFRFSPKIVDYCEMLILSSRHSVQ